MFDHSGSPHLNPRAAASGSRQTTLHLWPQRPSRWNTKASLTVFDLHHQGYRALENWFNVNIIESGHFNKYSFLLWSVVFMQYNIRFDPMLSIANIFPDNKVHGANMGPIWGRQDPDGPHVGPMNLAVWVISHEICTWYYDLICCG